MAVLAQQQRFSVSLCLKWEKGQAVGRSREEIAWRQLRERNLAEATNLRINQRYCEPTETRSKKIQQLRNKNATPLSRIVGNRLEWVRIGHLSGNGIRWNQ
jgi:hypothetical protein